VPDRLDAVIEAVGISRRFAHTVALDRVDFRAWPGEIHALVGENGAGKSTLIGIFAGRLKADAGTVALDGTPLAGGSAHLALKAGIVAVYQSPMLFERMSWEENLALGGFGAGVSHRDPATAAERARPLAARLGFDLPPAATSVEHCSIGERVRLEILRALSFDPRVLILDEPTGVLAPTELTPFLDLLRRLRGEGRIVIIVTHKLGEALAVADRVTVLRHGRVAAELIASATSEAELARLMIGEIDSFGAAKSTGEAADVDAFAGTLAAFVAPTENRTAKAIAVESLTLERDGRRVLDNVDFSISAGEIMGVAGVDGNGQGELVEILAGIHAPTSGRVRVMHDRPLAVIPQNRDLDGLILEMTLWENLMLARSLRRRFTKRGWLHRSKAKAYCGDVLDQFRIRSAGPVSKAFALSGGNRQRLAVARALAGNPGVLVAHDVCRGLDVRATGEVHRMLREFATAGGAVLLISSDLDELLALSTSLAVICRGRLHTVSPHDRGAERIGLLMSGAE
jgi:general nucleoside transport system ATP-binding protein